MSIGKLTTDYPIDVLFSNNFFTVQNRVTKRTLAWGGVNMDKCPYRGPALVAAIRHKALRANFNLWHTRFGVIPRQRHSDKLKSTGCYNIYSLWLGNGESFL